MLYEVKGAERTESKRVECIKVAVRVRPPFLLAPARGESEELPRGKGRKRRAASVSDTGTRKLSLVALPDRQSVHVDESQGQSAKVFKFDRVFQPSTNPDADNDALYEDSVRPIISQTLEGYNSTVFTYGQTGSGKTHTLSNIIPRSLAQIFDTVEENSVISLSYIEIYNERLKDLLGDGHKKKCVVREGARGEIRVSEMTVVEIHSITEALEVVRRGSASRHVAATMMNESSSRSHVILTVYVIQQNAQGVLASKVHLVDLAGSERNKRTGTTGERLKESISINSGLLALGNVITALARPEKNTQKNGYVPFRGSKLTRLLQDSLGGASTTLLIACVSPCGIDQEETISTLSYASRARQIKNKPAVSQHSLNAYKQKMVDLVSFGTSRGERRESTSDDLPDESNTIPPSPLAELNPNTTSTIPKRERSMSVPPLKGGWGKRWDTEETSTVPPEPKRGSQREVLVAEVRALKENIVKMREAIAESSDYSDAEATAFKAEIQALKVKILELSAMEQQGVSPEPSTSTQGHTADPPETTQSVTQILCERDEEIIRLREELQKEREFRLKHRFCESCGLEVATPAPSDVPNLSLRDQNEALKEEINGLKEDAKCNPLEQTVVALKLQVETLRAELDADEGIFSEYLAENRRIKRLYNEITASSSSQDIATQTNPASLSEPEPSTTPEETLLLVPESRSEVSVTYCASTHSLISLAELASLRDREAYLDTLAKDNFYLKKTARTLRKRLKRISEVEEGLAKVTSERDALQQALHNGCTLSAEAVVVSRNVSGLRRATKEEVLARRRGAAQEEVSLWNASHQSPVGTEEQSKHGGDGGGRRGRSAKRAEGEVLPDPIGGGGGVGAVGVAGVLSPPSATPSFADGWGSRSCFSHSPNIATPSDGS